MNWWRAGRRPADPEFDPAREKGAGDSALQHEPPLPLQQPIGNRALPKTVPKSEGEPIGEAERAELEAAFNRDLGDVRVHRDSDAAELSAAAGASAVASGRDIYFSPGAYTPRLLAHEVSHVVQQGEAASLSAAEDSFLEHEAEHAASAVIAGRAVEMAGAATAPAMQRQAVPGDATPPVTLMPTYSLTIAAFDIDKFALTGTQQQMVDDFAKRLQATLASAPDSIITIIGFADAPGTEPHNLALGQHRADSVRDRLVAKGISANQLHADSLGEGAPAVATKGYEARNRRVEINVVERTSFKPPVNEVVPAVPAQKDATPPSKPIDLRYHPRERDPDPSEELQEKLRLVDKAVREAQAAEKANPGTSAADAMGHVFRNAAKKLGLPQWVQDRAASLGEDLPSKGGQAVVDQIAGDRSLDANTANALKAVVDAVMHIKVK